MGIERFAEDVKESVKKKLGNGCDVTVRRVDKNNGVVYTGLCVRENDECIAPVVYIDSHYDRYKNGNATLADAADYVAEACRRKKPTVDIRKLLDYASVRGSIVYKLINTEKNRELLKDIPHKEFLDLSIVFQCMVTGAGTETATILIYNAHAKLWGVSEEELYEAASQNTPNLCGYELKGIKQVLGEIMQGEKRSGRMRRHHSPVCAHKQKPDRRGGMHPVQKSPEGFFRRTGMQLLYHTLFNT